MPRNLVSLRIGLLGVAIAVLLTAANCSQLPSTSSVAIPPVPAGTARIWIYRNDGPYEAGETPYVRLDSHIVGTVQPNGAFYRDVPPGHYAVTIDSYGAPYPNQFAPVDLGAGQEAFVKVLSKREKVGGPEASRAAYFTQLVPADVAWTAIGATPFYGNN
jgi:hypothetical protein